MSDVLKSLLEKREKTGTSFGELAGAYFTGKKKDKKKQLAILLGSLFFNAKESKMQSNVIRNLKELENDQTLQLANNTYYFNEALKKQNEYDEIEKKGSYRYYEDQAEQEFYDIGDHSENRNLYDGVGLSEKNAWKKDWANERYEQFKKEYFTKEGKAPTRLTTIEQFNKPLNDYFKAQQKEYTKPENLSLVHQAFSFMPGSKERDLRLEQDVVDKKALFESQRTRDEKLSQIASTYIEYAKPDSLSPESININNLEFDDIAKEMGITTNTLVYEDAFNKFSKLPKTGKILFNAETLLAEASNNRRVLAIQDQYSQVEARVNAVMLRDPEFEKLTEKERLKNKQYKDKKEKLIDVNIRKALNIVDPSEELKQSANILVDLMLENGQLAPKDREKAYKEELENQMIRLKGLKTSEQLQQEVSIQASMLVSRQLMENDINTQQAIGRTPLSSDQVAKLSLEARDFVQQELKGNVVNNQAIIQRSDFADEIALAQTAVYRDNFIKLFTSLTSNF